MALEGERAKTAEVTQAWVWLATVAQGWRWTGHPEGREGGHSGGLDGGREGAPSGGWVGSDLTGDGGGSGLKRRFEKRKLGHDWGQSVEMRRGVGRDGGLRIVLRAGLSCVDGCCWAV